MNSDVYTITKQEFSADREEYLINGIWPIDAYAEAYLDESPVSIEIRNRERISLFEQNMNRDMISVCRAELAVRLPDSLNGYRWLTVYAVTRQQRFLWFSIKVKAMLVTGGKASVTNLAIVKLEKLLEKISGRRDVIPEPPKTKDTFFCVAVTKKEVSSLEKQKIEEQIKKQTYSNWEIIYPDNQGVFSDELIQKSIHGKYVVFWNPEDKIAETALADVVFSINAALAGNKMKKRAMELIYGDDDELTAEAGIYQKPWFKPDFNLELLRSYNYIGRFFVVQKDLMCRLGKKQIWMECGRESEYLFRCVEEAESVYHVPEILCHVSAGSRWSVGEQEQYKKILQMHYQRKKLPVKVEKGETEGICRARYEWGEKPFISIIIPNKDHAEDLKRCMDSIEKQSSYANYEYIIVENNSVEDETFAYYEQLKHNNPKVKIVTWEGPFNYSAINNYGIQFASGAYYLLLNNDTAIINGDCLEELVGCCMQEEVGAVGARLYYEDDTIQHAGVIVGLGGIAGHAFTHCEKGENGYMNRITCQQEYSALTAACLLVKKSAYEAAGGLSEDLAVAFNDVDFCLKIREAGYRIIYNPYAELYHYESKSRGSEDTPEKVARFHGEIRTFENRWQEILLDGDPAYNKNLTLEKAAYLRRLC